MPIGIGAATIGAGALGAGASMYAANKQAKSAKKAAAVQQQMYDTTRADLSPYREAGLAALPGYQRLLGIAPDGSFDPAAQQKMLESTPGYQFALTQGMKGVTSALSARGIGGGSGAYGKGLARFVTGLADQTYQQQLGNYAGAVGIGQNAASQTGQFGSTAAGQIGGSLIGAGNAQAAGIMGAANGLSNAITGYATAPYVQRAFEGMYGGTPTGART